jgi:ADP-heptose:LPS heptosyltransferase
MRLKRTSLFKAADAVAGALLCRILGCLPSVAVREGGSPSVRSGDIRRILVIRPGGMGDMLLLLPVLQQLRKCLPDAVVDLACESRNLGVLELVGLSDRAVAYDSHPFAFLRQLRHTGYDVVLDTEQFHHFSAVFALLAGAPVRVGFKINPIRNPLYTHLVNYAPDGRETEQFARLLAPLGIPAGPAPLTGLLAKRSFPLPPDESGALATALREGAVALHAAASTPFKQWPPERFAELGAALWREFKLRTVLIGNERDRAVCSEIDAGFAVQSVPMPVAARAQGLGETAGILQRARLFVGPDSGLAHLAAALDVPTVVLFGPSDPDKWGVEDGRHVIIRKGLPCSPCFIFGYHKPCRTISCMRKISVEDVLAQCRLLM